MAVDDENNDDGPLTKLQRKQGKGKKVGKKSDAKSPKSKSSSVKAKESTSKTKPKGKQKTTTSKSNDKSVTKTQQKSTSTKKKDFATTKNSTHKKKKTPARSSAITATTKVNKNKKKQQQRQSGDGDDDDEKDSNNGEHHTLHGKRKQGGKKSDHQSKKKRKTNPDDEEDVEMTAATTATLKKKSKKDLGETATTKNAKSKETSTSQKTPNGNKDNEEDDAKITKSKKGKTDGSDSDDDDDEEEVAACCLCHCGMDCSDRALFFRDDRQREITDVEQDSDLDDYYFTMDDPFLPMELYDKNNALVYCDTCNRLYHQKCHFSPLLVVPHGKQEWECLLCSYQRLLSEHHKCQNVDKNSKKLPASTKKQKKQKKQKSTTMAHSSLFDEAAIENQLSKKQIKELYLHEPLPPPNATASKTNHTTGEKSASSNGNNGDNDNVVDKDVAARILEMEQKFELSSHKVKAMLLQQQLKQLERYINSQFGKIHQAQATLNTLTSTKKNRQHFMQRSKYSKASQELAQTILRMASAKLKIKECLDSLESIRVLPTTSTAPPIERVLLADQQLVEDGDEENKKIVLRRLEDWCRKNPKLGEHMFPFGVEQFIRRQRHVPRTQEMKKNNAKKKKENEKSDGGVPMEVVVPSKNDSSQCKKKKKYSKSSPASVTGNKNGDDDDDDDSGISLDDLQCCVCFIGDSTDDNDVLLCDGDGCYRAYHMKCVRPEITPDDISEDDDDDWFCPICSALGHLLHLVQSRYLGDEWEQRKLEEGIDDSSSLKSWIHAKDVFPNVEWEFAAAEQLKKGIDSAETRKLLISYVGDDFQSKKKQKYRRPEPQSDDEDEEDYSLFDETSFEERKRKEREEQVAAKRGNKNGEDEEEDGDFDDEDDDDGSLSTRSSQATLLEMSSVELNIGREELAALSTDDDESDDGDAKQSSDGSGKNQRRSKRLLKMMEESSVDESEDDNSSDGPNGADFDERNIMQGKRRRTKVDYRKLNDALFGDLSERERAQIDDADDFKVKAKAKRKPPSDDEEDDDDNNDDDSNKKDSSKEGADSSNGDSGNEGSDSDDGSSDSGSEDEEGDHSNESEAESD